MLVLSILFICTFIGLVGKVVNHFNEEEVTVETMVETLETQEG